MGTDSHGSTPRARCTRLDRPGERRARRPRSRTASPSLRSATVVETPQPNDAAASSRTQSRFASKARRSGARRFGGRGLHLSVVRVPLSNRLVVDCRGVRVAVIAGVGVAETRVGSRIAPRTPSRSEKPPSGPASSATTLSTLNAVGVRASGASRPSESRSRAQFSPWSASRRLRNDRNAALRRGLPRDPEPVDPRSRLSKPRIAIDPQPSRAISRPSGTSA